MSFFNQDIKIPRQQPSESTAIASSLVAPLNTSLELAVPVVSIPSVLRCLRFFSPLLAISSCAQQRSFSSSLTHYRIPAL